jgi:ADP-heptose:LPS heptosyltransferase
MKIAVFHNLPEGGALRTVCEQIKGLSKKHKVDLYQFSNSFYKDIKKYSDNVYVYNFSLENKLPSFLNRLYRDFRNFILLYLHHKKLARDIDNKLYDVVLVHTDMWTESPFILRLLKTPNVYHCHEILRFVYEKSLAFNENVSFIKRKYEHIIRNVRKMVDKKNAIAADKIVTSSDFVKTQVGRIYKKNAALCYPGVDVDIFKPYSYRKTFNLLFRKSRIQ